jgi:hypothetical protein
LARSARAPLIKKIQTLFDKVYVRQVEDHPMAVPAVYAPEDDNVEDVFHDPTGTSSPAHIRYQGVVFSCATTHPGNSQVMYSVRNGPDDGMIAPAIIQRIRCSPFEGTTLDIAPLLLSSRPGHNPFSEWPVLGAEIWSTATGPVITIELQTVRAQYISCKLENQPQDQIIISVSNVS